MKIKPSDADRFIARPKPEIRAVLLYGPDRGLVSERLRKLTHHVVDDPSDPFRIQDLSEADLKQDPARLADEAAAISMLGGRRVVRLRDVGDAVAKTVASFLDEPAGDALVLVEAGELGPRSSLRKAFEEAELGAAIACYADTPQSLEQVISDRLRAAKIAPDPAALDYLTSHLGADRGVTASEIEKLILYMGPDRDGHVRALTLEDARACIGDSAASEIDDLVDCACGGDLPGLDAALSRSRAQDVNPVVALNALIRHFEQLHLLAGQIESGATPDAAIRALRPPVHFTRAASLKRQIRLWPRRTATRALGLLLETETQVKSTGFPDFAVCAQAYLRIAQAARQARR